MAQSVECLTLRLSSGSHGPSPTWGCAEGGACLGFCLSPSLPPPTLALSQNKQMNLKKSRCVNRRGKGCMFISDYSVIKKTAKKACPSRMRLCEARTPSRRLSRQVPVEPSCLEGTLECGGLPECQDLAEPGLAWN